MNCTQVICERFGLSGFPSTLKLNPPEYAFFLEPRANRRRYAIRLVVWRDPSLYGFTRSSKFLSTTRSKRHSRMSMMSSVSRRANTYSVSRQSTTSACACYPCNDERSDGNKRSGFQALTIDASHAVATEPASRRKPGTLCGNTYFSPRDIRRMARTK